MAVRKEKARELEIELAPTYCDGKKRFPTLAAAIKQQSYGSKFDKGGRLQPYQCRQCHGFHNGNTARKKKPVPKLKHSWDDEVY